MPQTVCNILNIWDHSPPGRALPDALELLANIHRLHRIALWKPIPESPGNILEAEDVFDTITGRHTSRIRLARNDFSPLFSPSLTDVKVHAVPDDVAERAFGLKHQSDGPHSGCASRLLVEYPIRHKGNLTGILLTERPVSAPWPTEELEAFVLPARILGRLMECQAANTELQSMAKGRQVEREFLTQVQDIVRFGTWEFDVKQCTVLGSPESLAILGMAEQKEPCSLWRFFDHVHPDDRMRIEREVESLIGARSTQSCEFRVIHPDGAVRFVEIRGRLHWHHIATEDRVFGVMLDVTDRRAAERLRAEREAAHLAENSRSLFLANMSHELRTPLHGIVSYSRFGLDRSKGLPDQKLHGYFDEIYSSATQLMDLLSNLLDLARMGTGHLGFRFERHPVQQIVRECWSEWEAAFQEKGLRGVIEGTPEEVAVVCDRTRVAQCLRNLLSNAWKFAHRNTEVRLSWKVVGEKNEDLQISLSNWGVGIPEGEAEHIFERFAQSSRTQGNTPGTGLGLAICREIVDGHKGRIWAESDPDGATRFHIAIPISDAALIGGSEP